MIHTFGSGGAVVRTGLAAGGQGASEGLYGGSVFDAWV